MFRGLIMEEFYWTIRICLMIIFLLWRTGEALENGVYSGDDERGETYFVRRG